MISTPKSNHRNRRTPCLLHIPDFDGHVIDSKYVILHDLELTDEQRQAWKGVEDVIGQFTGADKYLFSLPMWNFGIPYRLKHYIDVIVQPLLTKC